ncbi:MAG TPA: response regulator [Rectinemataceae bacterium]|nr:response regulator [Rectinemataceae bacterium]
MSGHNETGGRKGGAAWKSLPLPLIFMVIVILSFLIFSGNVGKSEKLLGGAVAFHASEETAASIAGYLDDGAVLQSALERNPWMGKDEIGAISSTILKSHPFMIGVSTAPSAIVKYHFPESGNESLVGHDLLSNPERRDALTRSIETRAPVVSGPFESVEGGNVLFFRYPVFSGDKLWGFTSITVDFVAMIDAFGLEKHYPGFAFAFSGGNSGAAQAVSPGSGGSSESGERFLAGRKNAYSGGVSSGIELPGAEIRIHAMPLRGWIAADPFLYILLCAGLTGALLLFVIFYLKALKADKEGADSRPTSGEGRGWGGRPRSAESSSRGRTENLSAFDEATRAARAMQYREPVLAKKPVLDTPLATARGVLSTKNFPVDRNHGIATEEYPSSDVFESVAVRNVASGSAAIGSASSGAALNELVPETNAGNVERATSVPETTATMITLPRRNGKEVKFIGPEVKGQVYMPEVPVNEEPSLFLAAENNVKNGQTLNNRLVPDEKPRVEIKTAHREPKKEKAPELRRQEFLFSLEEEPGKSEMAILVVDDSEANRDIMGRMLSLRGYKADFAASGEDAILLCAARTYGIIFMDCFMPGMDGYKTSSALREKHPGLKSVIVGMSARMGDQELERCRLSGMDALLAKPFTLRDLLTHIEKR